VRGCERVSRRCREGVRESEFECEADVQKKAIMRVCRCMLGSYLDTAGAIRYETFLERSWKRVVVLTSPLAGVQITRKMATLNHGPFVNDNLSIVARCVRALSAKLL
jgi:hypothetical protein